MEKYYPKTLQELYNICSEALYEKADENFLTYSSVDTEVETKDGTISIVISPQMVKAEVAIIHKDGRYDENSLLAEEISMNVPTWDDLNDAYQSWYDEDYSDSPDPAFKSWTEVNRMFY